MNFTFQPEIIQPIAKMQIQVDSTANSLADDTLIFEDYLQSDKENTMPQRSPNPIPFAQGHPFGFGNNSEDEDECNSQSNSLVEGLYWFK